MAPSDFNVRYDPRPKAQPWTADDGSIGEDGRGIWVRVHPEVLLMEQYPQLASVLDEFQSGQTDLTAADFEQLAAPAYDAKLILADCWDRIRSA